MEAAIYLFFIFIFLLFRNEWLLGISIIGKAPSVTCCNTLYALS